MKNNYKFTEKELCCLPYVRVTPGILYGIAEIINVYAAGDAWSGTNDDIHPLSPFECPCGIDLLEAVTLIARMHDGSVVALDIGSDSGTLAISAAPIEKAVNGNG